MGDEALWAGMFAGCCSSAACCIGGSGGKGRGGDAAHAGGWRAEAEAPWNEWDSGNRAWVPGY